jgi:signal transduction histidine kinase
MRFRGKSIRRKIVALLVVPLVSLIAIWAFAALITADGVYDLMNVKRVTDLVAYPAEDTVDALAAERRAVLVYLADPGNPASAASLRAAELSTDQAIAVIRANAADPQVRGDLDAASRQRLTALIGQAGSLDALRRQVDEGSVSSTAALAAYDQRITPYYALFLGLNPVQSVTLDRQERVLVELARAREAVSREDALYAAAQAAGGMTRAEQRDFSDAVSQQRAIYGTYAPLLPAADAHAVAGLWQSFAPALALHQAEERILDAAPSQATAQVPPGTWNDTTSAVLKRLSTLDRHLADNYMQRVKPFAVDVLGRAAIAGALGLIAVVVSVAVSLRIGRSLARDLSELRREAQEASGTRLPRVMRRLAAGEAVDIEAEVPRRNRPDDEIGAVGKALDTLQRAAVEAAVRQADMRRGVSDVFVNLARRSQVLLHRQLTLLDAMERRTEAADELADLFRLDHMTTRMRRHAEGLVILSGAPPSRQWRRPVPLMDVVRAAVAEVEDYERVEVRRMLRLALAGSAVADLTHLLAELIENGTVFSPPHTTVQVHGERVANGYVLEIDDRGLGMPGEILLDANLRLAETPEFELSDTDRLGLFVVSRLAQRTGVRVSLRASPYGGTTAVVLIPNTLLTEVDEDETPTEERPVERAVPVEEGRSGDDLPDAIVLPVAAGNTEQAFRDWGILPTAAAPEDFVADARRGRAFPLRRFDLPEEHEQASGSPEADLPGGPVGRPRAGGLTDDNAPLPRRRRRVSTTAAGATAAGATRNPAPERADEGLPRRVRQASLAPQLREGDTVRPQWTAAPDDVPFDRDPEEVRARMASFQRGWQRGRAEADDGATDAGAGGHRTIPTAATDTAFGRGGDATGTTSEGNGR